MAPTLPTTERCLVLMGGGKWDFFHVSSQEVSDSAAGKIWLGVSFPASGLQLETGQGSNAFTPWKLEMTIDQGPFAKLPQHLVVKYLPAHLWQG